MQILGIETSGRSASIALFKGEECLADVRLESAGRRQAQTLVAEIGRLFRERELRLRDCEAVAVSIGPGSFTGLRIGVMCAKTLAYATGAQLAAVDTLRAIAENSPASVPEVFVASDAQRGQWYVGRYRREDGVFVRVGEVAIVDAELWCRSRAAGDIVSGPAVEAQEAMLRERCRVLVPELREPTAVVVARLGIRQLQESDADDPMRLVPFYLRRSAAEERRGE